jgi:hypothetical protein
LWDVLGPGGDRVEHIPGDRFGSLSELAGREWDVCIDVNGYLPLAVRNSCRALSQSVGRYVFVSTVSVYDVNDWSMNGQQSVSQACAHVPTYPRDT